MTWKAKYREFLKTRFWRELTAEKRRLVTRCERCKSKKGLQSHHRVYRGNWYETRMEDLEVLCRGCHRVEHGMERDGRFMRYREDDLFNRYLHRISMLFEKVRSGRALRDRDRRFMRHAIRVYPTTEKDGAMEFQVVVVLRVEKLMVETVVEG